MTIKPLKTGDSMTAERFFTGLLLLFMWLLSSQAQAEIKAAVDRPTLYFGESLTLTITSDQNTNTQPDFTLLDAVFHVGQTGKSSSTQIINGEMSTQTQWQVLLVPKSMGSHIIPPIEVDGERTDPIKITVNKPDPNAQAKGDIFIEIETNKESAFVQEEIILTVRLLYAIALKNGALSEPGGDGVIVQQINKGANYTTQRDGKTYQVLERKYAIFAENSGRLTLNPLVFEGEVTDNSRRSFGMFQRGRPIRQVSEIRELDIKQIPQSFIGQDWIPAKQLNLTQSWSQDKPYQVGEPITRTITLAAHGLSETQLPELQIPTLNGAKVYQDKTDTMTRTDGKQLIATKVIKYAVIPTSEGPLDIPALELAWYDTINQQPRTTTIPASQLDIEAATGGLNEAPQAFNFQPNKPPVTLAEPVNEPLSEGNPAHSIWQYTTYALALLWAITLVLLFKKKSAPQVNTPTTEPQISSAHLKRLKSLDPTELQQALVDTWNHRNNQSVTNLSQIDHQLADEDLRQALTDLQLSLYRQQGELKPFNWAQAINKGRYVPAQPQTSKSEGLPGLYE
ncbi:BatD family protein [Marinicella sediminis]|uniref:BatD family protein n=1 Tax=Marinicella sediminis TaxID=1792834 RepID=A0ABV7JAS4_9GAMM|nr:BatD family protein [Marinicella sediminis]